MANVYTLLNDIIWTQDRQAPETGVFLPTLLFSSLGNTNDQVKFSARNTGDQARLHREGISWDWGIYFLGTVN